MKISRNFWLRSMAVLLVSFGSIGELRAASILGIDFSRRGTDDGTNTAAGFNPFQIDTVAGATAIQTAATTRVFGAFTVTVSNSAPNGYDDRLRGAVLTNHVDFTEHLLLRDFVFSRDLNTLGGLDVSIAGLTPGLGYDVKLWSWDQGSGGSRVSDWFANGALVYDNWTFDGRVYPTNNNQYAFNFTATADVNGTLLLSGRREANSVDTANAASFGVFLNALQVSPVPEPSTYALIGIGILSFLSLRKIRTR